MFENVIQSRSQQSLINRLTFYHNRAKVLAISVLWITQNILKDEFKEWKLPKLPRKLPNEF